MWLRRGTAEAAGVFGYIDFAAADWYALWSSRRCHRENAAVGLPLREFRYGGSGAIGAEKHFIVSLSSNKDKHRPRRREKKRRRSMKKKRR